MNKIGITIKVYLPWFLVNFIFTMLPIMFTKLFPNGNLENWFSSFLVFIYTLLILSIFGLYSHLRTEDTPISFADVVLWFTLLIVIIIMAMFPIYNLVGHVSQFINSHIEVVTSLILAAGFISAVLLHSPMLKKQIDKLYSRRRIVDNPNRIKNNVKQMKSEMEEERSQ